MTRRTEDEQRRVLLALSTLAEECSEEFNFFPFAPITEEAKLDRGTVRRACRALARKGMAEFRSGLWTEDGVPAGAGYRLTAAGAAALRPAP